MTCLCLAIPLIIFIGMVGITVKVTTHHQPVKKDWHVLRMLL